MRKFILGVALATCSTVSFGNTCIGNVDEIQQAYNGRVSLISSSLYGDNGARDVCRLDQEWQGVSIEACKSWLSILMVGYTTGKKVWVLYSGPATCNSIGTWDAATRPHSIKLVKT